MKQQGGRQKATFVHIYLSLKQMSFIHQVNERFSQDEVAEHFTMSQSQVSRWIAKRQEIMRDAAQKHRKLLRKGKKPKKYVELYKVLC